MGRQSSYTQEVGDEICEWIASGNSLDSWIKGEPGRPTWPTVCKWQDDHPDFLKNYLRARELQADALADECLRIADTPVIGQKTTTEPNGDVKTTEGDMIEHRKLQIDARKWLAGKLRPRKYGDKLDVDHSGVIEVRWESAAPPNKVSD